MTEVKTESETQAKPKAKPKWADSAEPPPVQAGLTSMPRLSQLPPLPPPPAPVEAWRGKNEQSESSYTYDDDDDDDGDNDDDDDEDPGEDQRATCAPRAARRRKQKWPQRKQGPKQKRV